MPIHFQAAWQTQQIPCQSALFQRHCGQRRTQRHSEGHLVKRNGDESNKIRKENALFEHWINNYLNKCDILFHSLLVFVPFLLFLFPFIFYSFNPFFLFAMLLRFSLTVQLLLLFFAFGAFPPPPPNPSFLNKISNFEKFLALNRQKVHKMKKANETAKDWKWPGKG